MSSHDVFISYSIEDRQTAFEICRLLEDRGLRCWIAPRDVPPGQHYAEAIIDAIEEARATLLILSEFSNESVLVRNEIERAVAKGKTIIPVRVRQVQPSKALELYVSTAQWVDAWVPPLQQKIDEVVAAIRPLSKRLAPFPTNWEGARIGVFAIGGGAIRALNGLAPLESAGLRLTAVHTFAPGLKGSAVSRRIQLGPETTKGLNSGGNPEVGRAAAEEIREKLGELLVGYDLIFLVACFGGGTGTGAFPVIAQMARQTDALTLGIVTTPFVFEGARRMNVSLRGLLETEDIVDTMILIANEPLLRRGIPIKEAYLETDRLICAAVSSVSSLITMPGLINVDFADVRNVFKGSGHRARIGLGSARDNEASVNAARAALAHPGLEAGSLETARGLIVTISGGPNLSLYSVNEAIQLLQQKVSENTTILYGTLAGEKQEKSSVEITVILIGDSPRGSKPIV